MMMMMNIRRNSGMPRGGSVRGRRPMPADFATAAKNYDSHGINIYYYNVFCRICKAENAYKEKTAAVRPNVCFPDRPDV